MAMTRMRSSTSTSTSRATALQTVVADSPRPWTTRNATSADAPPRFRATKEQPTVPAQ